MGSNWVYLLVGLGLGLASRWLLGPKEAANTSLSYSNNKAMEDTAPSDLSPSTKQPSNDASAEQLQQTQLAYQLAHQMSQFKAGFLVRTSHELRSPLNSLIGLHQLILADLCDDPAEERKFVAQAHSCALKLVKLLDEILDVAGVEHGTSNLEIQPLPLAKTLEEVYQLTYLLVANCNFALHLSPPDPDVYVLSDPRWLRQILMNLVDACIIQMQEGSISISTSRPETDLLHVWIDVQPSISAWSEPIDLIQPEQTFQESLRADAVLSPGFSMLLNQSLVESLQGRLQILQVPTDADDSLTRIELTIPWVIPETAFPEQENQG